MNWEKSWGQALNRESDCEFTIQCLTPTLFLFQENHFGRCPEIIRVHTHEINTW